MATRRRINERDLEDLTEIIENFVEALPHLSEKDKIDLAARLKPIGKACKKIDEYVKDYVKTKLKHKDGAILGELFKAVLQLVPIKRLDQTGLKEEQPDIHEAYLKDNEDEKVTFELR